MKLLRNIWNTWKAVVDYHNSKITYVDYDDAWSYDMVFIPVLWSTLIGGLFGLHTLSIETFAIVFVTMLTALEFFLIVLPVIFEVRKMSKEEKI
jgi:hypothetical protein